MYSTVKIFKLVLFSFLLISNVAWAELSQKSILIISSYNPADQQTSRTISDFMDEYHDLGGNYNIVIENMNCKSFMGIMNWRNTMERILHKYQTINAPSLIILLGQEAFVSFLSVNDSLVSNIPVICSLVSRNVVLLPTTDIDVEHWMPESNDFINDNLGHGVVNSGFMYEYDIAANIEMILSLYPKTSNIAFISDNTYGGVTMQALVRKEMKKHPDINLLLLDGRVNTIYTIVDEIKALPENTAIMIGTWRIDKNEGYFMRNATYAMMEANPKIPVFAPASVGLGYWALGGVIPAYRTLGKELALEALEALDRNYETDDIEVISTRAVIDYNKMQELNLNVDAVPFKVEIINRPLTFYEQYQFQIWIVFIFVMLLGGGLLISLFFFFKTKRLKDKLQVSESELREAKNHAEESNRLKSAFLANMSHEIRTPLNAIVGFTDVLASIEVSKEEIQECNEIIKSNSDLLLRLINDILDLSRLESSRVNLEFEMYDVVRLCQQALASVEFSSKTNNAFIFESSYSSYELNTDIQRMQQVIINLLSNACKFTHDGEIKLSFSVDEEKGFAFFSVSDTGCGIPKDKQKTVFERFEKLNEHAQGTGLGLAICKLTVEKWGGDIWVDPGYVNGARFIFTHPLNKI